MPAQKYTYMHTHMHAHTRTYTHLYSCMHSHTCTHSHEHIRTTYTDTHPWLGRRQWFTLEGGRDGLSEEVTFGLIPARGKE